MLACFTLLACFIVPDRDLRRLVKQVSNGQEMFTLDELQGFLDKLVAARFFTSTPAEADVALAGSNREVRSAGHSNTPVCQSDLVLLTAQCIVLPVAAPAPQSPMAVSH